MDYISTSRCKQSTLLHMAASSSHARTHAELLTRARGADLLSNEENARLKQRAPAHKKKKKLNFFNSEDGGCYDELFERTQFKEVRSSSVRYAESTLGILRNYGRGQIQGAKRVVSTFALFLMSKNLCYRAYKHGTTTTH